MGVYIDNMEMPKTCQECRASYFEFGVYCWLLGKYVGKSKQRHPDCPIKAEIPSPHGRLIDADKLQRDMYHKAFEVDSDIQKWDCGCWIRYKMFEDNINSAKTLIGKEGD